MEESKILNFEKFINESEGNQGKIIVMLGPPGSGKGTLAKRLADKKGFNHISTGELIRNSDDKDLKKLIKGGNFIPDSKMIKMLKDKLSELDLSKGVILDGFPRNIKQAKMLDSMLGKMGLGLNHAVYLDVDEETAKDRIRERAKKESREDDASEETIEKRFSEYNKKTLPVLDFYSRSRKDLKLNASKSPKIVYLSLIKKINL